MASEKSSAAVRYLGGPQVRARYNDISDMTLWRWLHDEKLGFPQPVRINGRRFWTEDQLATWEMGHIAQQAIGNQAKAPEAA